MESKEALDALFFILFMTIIVGTIFALFFLFCSKAPEKISGVVLDLKKEKELIPSPVSDFDPMPGNEFLIEMPVYLLTVRSYTKIFSFRLTREEYEKMRTADLIGKQLEIIFSRDLFNLYLREWSIEN